MKRWISIYLIVILLTITGLSGTISTHADSIYIIRIGLTQNLKQQSKVKISTKKIAIGYCVNNRYSEYIHFTSKSGFTFAPATGYYLVSDTVYPDYASVKAAYNKVRKLSSVKKYTYICMSGKNKWNLYVGGLSDVAKVSGWQTSVEDKVSGSFSVTSYNGHRVKITGGGNRLIYDGDETGQYAQIAGNVLNKKGSKTLKVNGYEYRGRIEIGPFGGGKLTVINITNVENYLRGVVGSEMSRSAPMEAMKAQAIVSRTFAQNHCNNSGDTNMSTPYGINDAQNTGSNNTQKYGGYAKENKRAVEAVTSTRGRCIYSSGSQINASFFPSSGGATEASLNIWGNNLSYLRMVSDVEELSLGAKPWKTSYSGAELGKLVGLGTVEKVHVDATTGANRVDSITFTDTTGKTVTLKHDNIRVRLGLNSTKFKLLTKEHPATEVFMSNSETITNTKSLKDCYAISGSGTVKSLNNGLEQYVAIGADNAANYMANDIVRDGVFTFAGLGKGHGAGMSQAGATVMAMRGADYVEIIKKYYGSSVSIR